MGLSVRPLQGRLLRIFNDLAEPVYAQTHGFYGRTHWWKPFFPLKHTGFTGIPTGDYRGPMCLTVNRATTI